jgi:hypothetical protein
MKNTPQSRPEDGDKPRRVVKRVDPFSPWQLLVQERCADLRLSTRALTAKISTAEWSPEHTTVWAWLRSPEGTPPADTYTAALNRRMATALGIKPDVLAQAFEDSRRRFVLSSTAPGQQGPLSVLRTLFADSQRKTWKTEDIVKLIDDIRGM